MVVHHYAVYALWGWGVGTKQADILPCFVPGLLMCFCTQLCSVGGCTSLPMFCHIVYHVPIMCFDRSPGGLSLYLLFVRRALCFGMRNMCSV